MGQFAGQTQATSMYSRGLGWVSVSCLGALHAENLPTGGWVGEGEAGQSGDGTEVSRRTLCFAYPFC